MISPCVDPSIPKLRKGSYFPAFLRTRKTLANCCAHLCPFALVIGVDRGGYGDALKESGAHIVVDDLSELVVSKDRRIAVKTTVGLPSVWDCEGELRARLSGRSLAAFLDYDGTLTPIVEDHTKAFLIRWFSDLDRSDTATVGGKNSSLGEMIGKLKQAGINVPDGFATTADAYWKFLEANDLIDRMTAELAELKTDGSNLADIGKAVRKMILQADLPDPLAQAITRGLREMAERSGHKITSVTSLHANGLQPVALCHRRAVQVQGGARG